MDQDRSDIFGIMTALASALAVTATVQTVSKATGTQLQPASLIDTTGIDLTEYQAWKKANAPERPEGPQVCEGFVAITRPK